MNYDSTELDAVSSDEAINPESNGEFHAAMIDHDPVETQEWRQSLQSVVEQSGADRGRYLLETLKEESEKLGAAPPFTANTAYVNTILAEAEPEYPGDREMERRIKGINRWNAVAMVVRGIKRSKGLGGHLATYASSATLYQVAMMHFFRGKEDGLGGDQIYFQGHGSPGIYAQAFLEGTLSEQKLINFRRELAEGGGLSSYPHPWLMPDFWEFPTVSMGLGPLMSIYQARFNRYLQARGLADTSNSRVWAFLGDGEMDEPESLGAITMGAREHLDNLTWVINCNLQRLDGPVRGNGKIIQELEGIFRGAGWNVIKLLWGSAWDEHFAQDHDGALAKRLMEVVDGQFQKYTVETGEYIRQDFIGDRPELQEFGARLTDDELRKLFFKRGGHDPIKVYAAFHQATHHTGQPTVVLAHTVKGYALGETIAGRNTAHQKKEVEKTALKEMRDRYHLPIPDDHIEEMPFYHPGKESPEVQYLLARRKELHGLVPRRVVRNKPFAKIDEANFEESRKGTGKREVSTTMAFVSILSRMLKDKEFGKLIVPIVPDESRTFGLDPLFSQAGIYSSKGQLYEPVDSASVMYYKESEKGQILQEGISEAGGMSSFVAAGTAYSTHATNTIPFYIYYSMFGFQRIGDLIWANGDARGKGFLLGATYGRTTLNGEGLQHEDGHSILVASTVPNCIAYDPAFAYEVGVIIKDGLRRMYQKDESIFYYITLYNENYVMPPLPEGVEEGILKGLYKYKPAFDPKGKLRVHLFGSGVILQQALKAQEILHKECGIEADVWSATSYSELRRDALECERWNMLHPTEKARIPYISQVLAAEPFPVVSVSDNMKVVADQISRFLPGGFHPLGTDGFGRSEDRKDLRRHFEIDPECVAIAAAYSLCKKGQFPANKVAELIKKLGVNPEKVSAQYA
ncbi:MAG: pyruvate dehydrogenase (acetyl-transferring), homodimeric type [Planctomycetia bacterium]|nr:pyruvate dehydrogenase (acetyl-transferring), homodimeric type [Planctomycetia bacterium]